MEKQNENLEAIKKMNIYEKLSAITMEITGLEKDLTVGFGGQTYKAMSESQVLWAVKKVEAKYRVYSYPYSRRIIESGQITTDKGKTNFFERIEVVYRFVNMDNSSEFVDITSYGDGIDPQDKSVSKSMTYSDKYALMKAYKITTGEDPDQNPSEEQGEYKKNEPKFTTNPQILAGIQEVGLDVDGLAKYLRKSVDQLTEEELLSAIERKKKALQKATQAK